MSKKILIVASNYYKEISANLVKGAIDTLENLQYTYDIINVRGSFEIPFIINRNIKLYHGFIALGCIVRGEAYHFELISNEVTRKIIDLSIDFNKPIGFGIITCDNIEQAKSRSIYGKNVSFKNKGQEAALAVTEIFDNYL